MKRINYTCLMAAAAWLALQISGCSTLPERIDELEQARVEVENLQRETLARDAASTQLESANDALARADLAVENGESIDLIRHEAYVARRHAEIGQQLVAEAEAQQTLEQAESMRQEVQLEAREAELRKAQLIAERRAAEAEAALDEAEQLAGELESVRAAQTERGLVLTLGDVLFDTGKAELKDGASLTLDRLARFLDENPDRRLLIEGHTDSRGSDEFNRQLSSERAQSVADAITVRGVSGDRLRTAGLGEDFPVASNEAPAGRQQNRRVEIIVSDADGSFPASADRRAATETGY